MSIIDDRERSTSQIDRSRRSLEIASLSVAVARTRCRARVELIRSGEFEKIKINSLFRFLRARAHSVAMSVCLCLSVSLSLSALCFSPERSNSTCRPSSGQQWPSSFPKELSSLPFAASFQLRSHRAKMHSKLRAHQLRSHQRRKRTRDSNLFGTFIFLAGHGTNIKSVALNRELRQ